MVSKRTLRTCIALLTLIAVLLVGAGPAFAQGTFTYTVQFGDTLGALALRYNTSVQAIAVLNGIPNPSYIYVGQRLAIPAGSGTSYPSYPPYQGHVVQPGQNLFRIGLIYGYDVYTMAAVNGLANPNWIYAGQVLRVPRAVYHTVRYGDTVASIAYAYGSSVSAIAAVNHLWNANLIYPGQVLQVP